MGNFLDNIVKGAFVFSIAVVVFGGVHIVKYDRKDLMNAWWFYFFVALLTGAWIWR